MKFLLHLCFADSNGDYYNLGTSFGRESFYNIIRVPVEAMNKPDPMKELKVFARAKISGNSMKPAYMHRQVAFTLLFLSEQRFNFYANCFVA